MEATFLTWSAAASSQERREVPGGGGGVFLSQQMAAVVTAEPTGEVSPRRRAAKKKKSGGQKKPPQRGLGVEKLERLRLQERWRMMTEIEPPLADQQIQSNDDRRHMLAAQCQAPHSPFVQQCGGSLRFSFPPYGAQHQAAIGGGRMPLAKVVAVPAPVSYGGAPGDSCFLQRHRLLGPGGVFSGNRGALFASASSSENHDDGAGDRLRPATAMPGVQADRLSLELPSSSQSLQRFEQHDICGGEIEVKGGSTEIKVYEFFPCSSSSSSSSSGSSGRSRRGSPIERRTADGEPPSSISARSSRHHLHLDLSLKLSSQ
ncbi:unnamed protein product [Spirodela intermedia]|uniref:Uncharacterized protein n=1 Tax=Spirodela intermedia TaxID=51605 RepID=A0A7I8IKI2_SPIIN|nr:unnamed protein product [Spirodela intermedia]CAA6658393.1 unnamed protein product [Spirodela intermedia]